MSMTKLDRLKQDYNDLAIMSAEIHNLKAQVINEIIKEVNLVNKKDDKSSESTGQKTSQNTMTA